MNKKIFLILFVCLSLFCLKACGGSSSSDVDSKKQVTNQDSGESVNVIEEPNPEENNSSLLGIDLNEDDIRDDLENYLDETYQEDQPVLDYLEKIARQDRLSLKALEASDFVGIKNLATEQQKTLFCLTLHTGGKRPDIMEGYKAMALNTGERVEAEAEIDAYKPASEISYSDMEQYCKDFLEK